MPLPLAEHAIRSERGRHAGARIEAPRPLGLWHLASLDAPSVAVVWTLSFAKAVGVHLPLWVPVLIGMGTWFVYVGDRILDTARARAAGNLESLRERHFFHWRHRHVLVPLAACAAIASTAIVFGEMPAAIRKHDSALAVAALTYFSGIHVPGARPRWLARLRSKEVLVGVLFTAGCALPTMTRLHAGLLSSWQIGLLLAVLGCYAALAWLNCAAIDQWESNEECGGQSMSASRIESPAQCTAVSAGVLALASAAFSASFSILAGACAASALLLWALDRQRKRLAPLALRCAADLVLLTPLICLVR